MVPKTMTPKSNTARRTWDRPLIQAVLGQVALFRGATPPQIKAAADRSWTLEATRGRVIAAKGDCLPGLFALAYGRVKLSLRRAGGEERVLRLAQAGESFGEAAALLSRQSPYEARAMTDAKLVVIPSSAVFALLDSDPRAARQVALALAQRKLDLIIQLESSTLRSGAQRLAVYLDSLSEGLADAGTVRLPASKTLIASRLDMKKETLSRLLRAFSGQGLIAVNGPEITILDPGALASMADRPVVPEPDQAFSITTT